MATGRSGRSDRPAQRQGVRPQGRGRRVMKPIGWPRYMLEKRLKSGTVAYYWNPPVRDTKGGFTLRREALGPSYGAAAERAELLNAYLDAWRTGGGVAHKKTLSGYGTLGWLFERYRRSNVFQQKVSPRA